MVTLRAIFHHFYTVCRISLFYDYSNIKLLHSHKCESNIYTTFLPVVSYSSDRRFKLCVYALHVFYLMFLYIYVVQVYRLSDRKYLSLFF